MICFSENCMKNVRMTMICFNDTKTFYSAFLNMNLHFNSNLL